MRIPARTAVILPDVGAAVSLGAFTRYALLDRGSYAYTDDVTAPFAELAALASRHAGRALTITEARAVRLVPGDYILAHHDRVHDDLPIELVLDVSPAPADADIHYRRRGDVFFRVPCAPRSLAIVERGPAVTRNFCYVSRLQPAAEVVRVVMLATSGA